MRCMCRGVGGIKRSEVVLRGGDLGRGTVLMVIRTNKEEWMMVTREEEKEYQQRGQVVAVLYFVVVDDGFVRGWSGWNQSAERFGEILRGGGLVKLMRDDGKMSRVMQMCSAITAVVNVYVSDTPLSVLYGLAIWSVLLRRKNNGVVGMVPCLHEYCDGGRQQQQQQQGYKEEEKEECVFSMLPMNGAWERVVGGPFGVDTSMYDLFYGGTRVEYDGGPRMRCDDNELTALSQLWLVMRMLQNRQTKGNRSMTRTRRKRWRRKNGNGMRRRRGRRRGETTVRIRRRGRRR